MLNMSNQQQHTNVETHFDTRRSQIILDVVLASRTWGSRKHGVVIHADSVEAATHLRCIPATLKIASRVDAELVVLVRR